MYLTIFRRLSAPDKRRLSWERSRLSSRQQGHSPLPRCPSPPGWVSPSCSCSHLHATPRGFSLPPYPSLHATCLARPAPSSTWAEGSPIPIKKSFSYVSIYNANISISFGCIDIHVRILTIIKPSLARFWHG